MPTKLSVNINKVALIRNSRGENLPDLIQFAQDCERFGAEGITVHPRPDERHVRYDDLIPLKEVVQTEFNIEGYPNERFMQKVLDVKPHQCTLVPDPPGVLTSNTGWDIAPNAPLLKDVISRLKDNGIRVSLFMNAESTEIEQVAELNADRIELYTGKFAKSYAEGNKEEVAIHKEAAYRASQCGLGINAGHDLNLKNLNWYSGNVPNLLEVSIGHSLISDALYYGIQNTILMYLQKLKS